MYKANRRGRSDLCLERRPKKGTVISDHRSSSIVDKFYFPSSRALSKGRVMVLLAHKALSRAVSIPLPPSYSLSRLIDQDIPSPPDAFDRLLDGYFAAALLLSQSLP